MTIEDVIARAEIGELLVRYCRGIDRLDWDLVRSCFWPDGIADYRAFGLTGTPDALVAFLQAPAAMPALTRTMHVLSNHTIALDADRARSEAYCMAHHEGGAGHIWDGRFAVTWLRYLDRWERRDGRWAILHREVAVEWGLTLDVEQWAPFPPDALGRRDRADRSYSD